MRRIFIFVALLGCAACGKKTPTERIEPRIGGTIAIKSCGYQVTTRDGASAPVLGEPVFGPSPAPAAVHLGLTGDPATSMVITWRTDDATRASTVQYGINGNTDETFEGFTSAYDDLENQVAIRMHEAHLCGLSPDTEYSYRVGGADDTVAAAWSPVYTFRTAPSDPAAEIVALAIGDTREGYATWGQSLERAFSISPPDVILFSGDAESLGVIQDGWDQWFMAADSYLHQVPLVFAHGNHEANAINYYSQFANPGDEENFGVTYGPLHVSVINDTPLDPSALSAAIPQVLEQDLTDNASAPWRLVMHHQPIWSASAGHGSDTTLRAQLEPVFDRQRPDMVISGHDHNYERTKPLRNGAVQPDPASGTIHVIVGSAGAPLYDNGSDFWTQYSEKTNSFSLLRVRVGRLQFDAYRPDGSSIDSFVINK